MGSRGGMLYSYLWLSQLIQLLFDLENGTRYQLDVRKIVNRVSSVPENSLSLSLSSQSSLVLKQQQKRSHVCLFISILRQMFYTYEKYFRLKRG